MALSMGRHHYDFIPAEDIDCEFPLLTCKHWTD